MTITKEKGIYVGTFRGHQTTGSSFVETIIKMLELITNLKELEELPEEEFQAFFQGLPERVKLIVKGGLVNWKEVLPLWYRIKKVDSTASIIHNI